MCSFLFDYMYWCPRCRDWALPEWRDCGLGTVEWWGTRVRDEAMRPFCPYCDEIMLEDPPPADEEEED